MLTFLNKKGYSQGIIFLMLMMLVSCMNDVIVKHLGERLHTVELIFFRFFFSLFILLPIVFQYGSKAFKTAHPLYNILRGVLGVVSFYLYTYSLVSLQLVEVVTILWSVPLFVLVFAFFFLKERVSRLRWIATIVGFTGLSIVSIYGNGASFSFQFVYVFAIISAMLFAAQDVLIKKMVATEKRITMLLYFSIVTTCLTFVPALCTWKTPTLFELTMLVFCGLFANLIQYFLFKAFEATDLSALAPFKYIEFLLSAVMGFIFFAEVPGVNAIFGAAILIPSTLYLVYSENKKSKNKNFA